MRTILLLLLSALSCSAQLFGLGNAAYMASAPAPPLIPSPVLWWKMGEGSGTTLADSSGNGYTGTLSGSTLPSWNSGTIAGQSVNYLSFNGTTAYVTAASGVTQIDSVKHASMTAWVLIGASGNWWAIGAEPANLAWFGIMEQSGSTLGMVSTIASGGTYGFYGEQSAAAWHFETVTYDGTQGTAANRVKVYLDGVSQTLTTSGTFPTTLDTAANVGPMFLARNVNNSFFGTQSTADFRVFNLTLSQAQITAMYNAGPQ